tara:strand:- start:9678 stop:10061 length:384 start_codon:yes stop_codon:yes gene_type:complete
MNINNGTYAGRLTRDVDLRHAPSGTAIANIGLAINRRRKRGDEWVDEAVFVDVKLFGNRAEAFAKYHTKGSAACFPQCELVYESWETKEGDKRSKLVLHANGFEFVGARDGGSDAPAQAAAVTDTPF